MMPTHGQSKDEIKDWKDCKPTDDIITVWFTCVLENIGSLPSKDIFIKTSRSSSPINKNNFHEFIRDSGKTTLLPGEDYHLDVSLTMEQFKKSNEIPSYCGIHVKYSYDDENYESIGKVFKLCQDGIEMPEYWNDEPPNIKYD